MATLPLVLRRRPPPEALRWVERSVGGDARVTSIQRLRGGTSTAVHLVRLRDRGGTQSSAVLRRFVRLDWFAREPDIAEREARILRALQPTGVATPRLIAVDARGEECDVAAVLMTRLAGRLDLAPSDPRDYVRRLAEPLSAIHGIGTVPGVPSYYPYSLQGGDLPVSPPDWCRDRTLWESTRVLAAQPWPEAQPTLVHRDYHPGNILWTRGAITGITDWASAANGPSGVDAAHMRANLADLFGLAVAEDFRDAYEAVIGSRHHPYWDLLHAVDRGEVDAAQWHEAGRADLTDRLIARRREEYLESLVRALC